jgi:hypothetical protein
MLFLGGRLLQLGLNTLAERKTNIKVRFIGFRQGKAGCCSHFIEQLLKQHFYV